MKMIIIYQIGTEKYTHQVRDVNVSSTFKKIKK